MSENERSSRLPFVHIDIAPDMPEPLEAARKVVAQMFDLEAPSAEIAERFEMKVSVYDLGAMQMSTCTSSASILTRSTALVALTHVEHFIAVFYRSGSFSVTLEDERIDVPTGALTFFDLSRPSTIVADRVDNLGLTIPPDLLLPLVANPSVIHGLALRPESEANVALTMHMEDLWLRLPDMTPQEADAECQSLAAMFAAVIGAHVNRRSMARAHLRKNQFGAICRWIDGNLGNAGLDPATITAKFCMTRPTLYRMFEQRGGLMKYILERRLENVYRDLLDATLRHEKINAVMHRWGLRDHTSAGRAFRSYFGVTPRQVRANTGSQLGWPPVASTEAFRIKNMERLGPLLEQHKVRITQDKTGKTSPG
ncbi:AraC-like DNA-binding protein [Rhizobium aquaticum]|uniref:AraC-like DNA-binding protein n=1 Tax=Rhizobium aquaticum TaxID=1549636 RepID=A0ABV2IVB0_9HYPH